jgi:hypothetical protein
LLLDPVRWAIGIRSFIVLIDFAVQEPKRFLHFIHAIHTVLDTNPTFVLDAAKQFEDCIVVIEAFASHAMDQELGVARSSFGEFEVFQRGSGGQVAVAGVHADDPWQDFFEQRHWIIAGNECVARVVLHPEVRGLRNTLQQIEEDVLLLGELCVLPKSIFVMVFQSENDILMGCGFDAFANGLAGVFEPLFA